MRTPWTIQYDNDTAWWMAILINFFFVKKNNKNKKITKTEQQKQTRHTKTHLIKDSFHLFSRQHNIILIPILV